MVALSEAKADEWDPDAIVGLAWLFTFGPGFVCILATMAIDLATGTPIVDHPPAPAAAPFLWWGGLFMSCFFALFLVAWFMEWRGWLRFSTSA